jgi:hypothetical protein
MVIPKSKRVSSGQKVTYRTITAIKKSGVLMQSLRDAKTQMIFCRTGFAHPTLTLCQSARNTSQLCASAASRLCVQIQPIASAIQ